MAENNPASLLGEAKTAGYKPHPIYVGPGFSTLRRLPNFTLSMVRDMLYDPRIRFGLWLIKGPILTKRKFEVECDRDDVADYVNETIDRFWNGRGAAQALRCVEYGYSCNEVMYEVAKGRVQYKELRPVYPTDASALEYRGEFAGALIRNIPDKNHEVFLGGAKCFWPTHESDFNRYYGMPRLLGAYPAWVEKWHEGGARDIRKLFFYKYAYNGGFIQYPYGTTPVNNTDSDEPTMVDNQHIARSIVDNIRTGGTITMPYRPGVTGQNEWQYTPGGGATGDAGQLMEYCSDLDDEIWEGLGIPPEVARAEGSSGAFGGRAVPQEAFYAILHILLCELTDHLIRQIVHPLVVMTFGRDGTEFKVRPYGLMEEAGDESEDMTDVNEDGIPDDQQGGADGQPNPADKPAAKRPRGKPKPKPKPKPSGSSMSSSLEESAMRGRQLRGFTVYGGGNWRHGE